MSLFSGPLLLLHEGLNRGVRSLGRKGQGRVRAQAQGMLGGEGPPGGEVPPAELVFPVVPTGGHLPGTFCSPLPSDCQGAGFI